MCGLPDSAKQLAAQLGAVGKTIDDDDYDDDLIAYIVSGLNHSYHPLVTSLCTLPPEIKLSPLKTSEPKYPTKSHSQTFRPPYYFKKHAPNTQSYPSPRPKHPQQTFHSFTVAASRGNSFPISFSSNFNYDLSLSNIGFDLSLSTHAESSTSYNSPDWTIYHLYMILLFQHPVQVQIFLHLHLTS